MTKKIVIYTAIFGSYDGLLPQRRFPGVDYVCFTDQSFKSNTWKVINVEPQMDNDGMDNRRVKLLPHLFLKDYDISIYIDGNFIVRRNPIPLVERVLADFPMAAFDHNQTKDDKRNCVYEEAEALYKMEKEGNPRESSVRIKQQIDKYRSEGYPANNGLIKGGILIRKHHEPTVIKVMEGWWEELQKESHRDQLSFNYVAWKHQFSHQVIEGNLRNHEYFYMIGVHRKDYTKKYLTYRIKSVLGMLRDL